MRTTFRTRRGVVTFVTVVAAAFALVAPAAAQPVGSDEIAPNPPPDPDPEVALQAFDRCDPDPGVDYEVAVLGGPDGRPFTVRVDWTNVDTGDSGSSTGASGSASTGEGTVELVAVVDYPALVTLEGDHLAAVSISSAVVTVLVDCPDEEPGPEDPGPEDPGPQDPNPTPGDDPDVRSATPTFTG